MNLNNKEQPNENHNFNKTLNNFIHFPTFLLTYIYHHSNKYTTLIYTSKIHRNITKIHLYDKTPEKSHCR